MGARIAPLVKGEVPARGTPDCRPVAVGEAFRRLVTSRVMRDHKDLFKTAAHDPKEGGLDRKDTRLLLTMALHAADICNPAKPVPIATTWARRSTDEFFKQGDKEVRSRRTRRRAVPCRM